MSQNGLSSTSFMRASAGYPDLLDPYDRDHPTENAQIRTFVDRSAFA